MKPRWLTFPPPLQVGIPLLVLVFSLVYDGANSYVLVSRETRLAYRNEQRVALAQAAWLADAVQTFHGDENGAASLERDVRLLVEDSKVTFALVCDLNQIVRYSTEKEWVGQDLKNLHLPDGLMKVVERATRTSKPIASKLTKGMVASAQLFHKDENGAPTWLSVVSRDPSEAVKKGRRDMLIQGGISAALHLFACACLWWALHCFLSKRVTKLLESTRRMTKSALRPEPMTGSDEFAQIARALRESEDIFQQIVENIRDVIFLMTADRKHMLYLSAAHEEIWGVKAPPPGTDPAWYLDSILEEDRPLMMKFLDPFNLEKRIVDCEYRIRHPDGEIRWLETRAFPVLDEHGKIYRIAGLTTDVTERKLLEQEVLDISEKERRRIGHDLHDDVCQRLAAVKLNLETVGDTIATGKLEEARRIAASCSKHIGEAATLARNLARGLSPVNLEGEGFLHAIHKLVETSQHLYAVKVTLDCPETLPMQKENTATHIYRIAQELINNAARHAGASCIHVSLRVEGTQLCLRVTNDGRDFPTEIAKGERSEGMGLRIIRYRANAIGANVQYFPQKKPETGTIAVCSVPLTACIGTKKTLPH